MRDTFIRFALPDMDSHGLEQIREAPDSGCITTRPKTRQFEQEFPVYVGAEHAIAVDSCTVAIHLALDIIGLQRGDIVLTTPYTFVATTEAVRSPEREAKAHA